MFRSCIGRVVWAAGMLCLVTAPAAGAELGDETSAEAVRLFRHLYADAIREALASADPDDDIELAKRLIEDAHEAGDHPTFVTLLCESAGKLAAARPDRGADVALEAVELLAERVPAKARACAERRVDILRDRYARVPGEEKAEAAEPLLDALLAEADAHAVAEDFAAAVADLMQALGISRSVGSDRVSRITARLKQVRAEQRRQKQIEHLKDSLRESPDDTATRERLVRVHLVERDDPAAAVRYVKGVEDENLARFVPAAAKGVEVTPELACPQMGDWYRKLAAEAPRDHRPAMLARAAAYYERFLELHEANDLQRTAAELALKHVREELAQAPAETEPDPPTTPRPTPAPTSGDRPPKLNLPKKPGVVATYEAHAQPIRGLQVSPDGRRLVIYNKEGVTVWDIEKRTKVIELSDLPGQFEDRMRLLRRFLLVPTAISRPGGRTTARAAYDVVTGRKLWEIKGKTPDPYELRPDGKVLFGFSGGEAVYQDPETGRILATQEVGASGLRGFSPDGRIVYYLRGDNVLAAIDFATGKTLAQGAVACPGFPTGGSRLLRITPDGRQALAKYGKKAYLIDLRSGRPVRTFTCPVASREGLVNFVADGRVVAVGQHRETFCFYTDSGKPLCQGQHVWPGSVSPDGKKVIRTIRRSNKARIVDGASGEVQGELVLPKGRFGGGYRRMCAWSQCGDYVFLGGDDVKLDTDAAYGFYVGDEGQEGQDADKGE